MPHKKGSESPFWKGGKSNYPLRRDMLKNKFLKFKQENGKCEICKNKAYHIHHIDGSKENHSIENLAVLCKSCHYSIHANTKKSTSKFKRIYGITLYEIANKFGGTYGWYYSLYRKNKLNDFLISKNFQFPIEQNIK